MSGPYVAASTPQIFFQNKEQQVPLNAGFAHSAFLQERYPLPTHGFQEPLYSHTIPSSPPSGALRFPHQEPLQIPYRGLGQTQQDSLSYSVSNRKGPLSKSLSGYSTGEETPSLIQEHIQRRPYGRQEDFQDLEGLDVIRVQATRISNLLDRIEVLEREVERQAEIQKGKDKDLAFWEKQYHILDDNKDDADNQLTLLDPKEVNKLMGNYNEDKKEIERKIAIELREIEEFNTEIAYYKSLCTPNEDETEEVKRLQNIEAKLLSDNVQFNRQLLAVSHYQQSPRY